MARRGKREYDDDDGRTIVKMNVDGMPWYTGGFTPPEEEVPSAPPREKRPLSKEESRGYAFAAVKASLLVGAVYAGVFTLFLLFCYFVWFR